MEIEEQIARATEQVKQRTREALRAVLASRGSSGGRTINVARRVNLVRAVNLSKSGSEARASSTRFEPFDSPRYAEKE
jgi:hypothetical protein